MNILRRARNLIKLRQIALTGIMGGLMIKRQSTIKAQTIKHTNREQPGLQQFQDFDHQTFIELQKNNDVVIVIDPENYQEFFLNEIFKLLDALRDFKQQNKRKLVILNLKRRNDSQLKQEFKEKYDIDIEDEAIFLIKNKYIKSIQNFTIQDYFENRQFLIQFFRPFIKITEKNNQKFLQTLDYLSKDDIVILAVADKNSSDKSHQYQNMLSRFKTLQLNETFQSNQNINWVTIDRKTAELIKINDSKNGDIYIMQKSTKFTYNKIDYPIQKGGLVISKASHLSARKVDDIIQDLQRTYSENNLFAARGFNNQNTKYSFVLEVDLNKTPKQEQSKLIKSVQEFKEHLLRTDPQSYKKFQFVYLNKQQQNKQGYSIYIRDDEMNAYRITNHQETNPQNIKQGLEKHSFTYKLSDDLIAHKNTLISLYEQVKNGSAPEYFASQEPPKYKKYSLKVVGKTFRELIMEPQSDIALFEYSKHCHACGEYGQYYENLALENLREGNNIIYGRFNNDRNKTDQIQDFPYTPVFLVLRNGIKDKPYVYRNEKFTPQMLKNFFKVSFLFQIIPEQMFQNHIENFIKFQTQ